MWKFWDTRGHFAEGWARLDRAMAAHAARDETRLAVLIGAGALAFGLDYTQRSDDILGEAMVLARELGNAASEAEATVLQAFDRTWQAPTLWSHLLSVGSNWRNRLAI